MSIKGRIWDIGTDDPPVALPDSRTREKKLVDNIKESTGVDATVPMHQAAILSQPDAAIMMDPRSGMPKTRENLQQGAMTVPVSKLFADGGARLDSMTALALRMNVASIPHGKRQWNTSVVSYLDWCKANMLAPTWGMFAAYNGTTVSKMNIILRDKRNREDADALDFCRGVIQAFMETAAMEGTLNPLMYQSMMNRYFGDMDPEAVIGIDTDMLSDDEFDERVDAIIDVSAMGS